MERTIFSSLYSDTSEQMARARRMACSGASMSGIR